MSALSMAFELVGQNASAAMPGTIVISCLQEIQMQVRRMETKQTQMQSSLDELIEILKASQESSFTVKGSPFQVCVYDTAVYSALLRLTCMVCGYLFVLPACLVVVNPYQTILCMQRQLECKVALLFAMNLLHNVSPDDFKV